MLTILGAAIIYSPKIIERAIALPVETPPEDGVELTQTVPLDVSTFPLVPGDANPVPPFAAANVPPRVKVPEVVIAPPVKVKPVVPPEPLTEVTVPTPKPEGLVAG